MNGDKSNDRELLRAAVHDLRGPLNQLRAFTDLLCRKYGEALPEEASQFCEYIHSAAKRGSLVVERLDAYAQALDPPLVEDVELNFEVDCVLNKFPEGVVRRNDLGSVSGDSAMMRRLFGELIDNALKFHRGDRPAVEIRREGARISVIDNGIGIPAEMNERAFAPMKRLNGFEFEGGGMGLTICRRIVEAHNGKIWLESREGRGTMVHLELP